LGTLVAGSTFHGAKHMIGCVLMLNSYKGAISPVNRIHDLGDKAWWQSHK
jgi:hypothetical protein